MGISRQDDAAESESFLHQFNNFQQINDPETTRNQETIDVEHSTNKEKYGRFKCFFLK